MTAGSGPAPGLRIDKWLWHARLCRTRSLAGRLCAAGAVTLGGVTVVKAHQLVRVGDHVMLCQGRWRRTVQVQALGIRRGSAAEAQALYHEAAAPERLRDPAPDWVSLFDSPDGSEDKG